MKIIAVLTLALLLTACAASTEYYKSIDDAHYKAKQDTLRVYDSDGNFAGHIEESSKGTRVYDRDGNFVGFIK